MEKWKLPKRDCEDIIKQNFSEKKNQLNTKCRVLNTEVTCLEKTNKHINGKN